MADGRETKSELSEREARAESPPLTAEQFVATSEFKRFKKGMRKILKVSKTELDERVLSDKSRRKSKHA
jgi:hypothetical protein